MKANKLQDAIGMVDGDLIARADMPPVRRRLPRWWRSAVAAMLAVVLLLGSLWNIPPLQGSYAIAEASYPVMAPYPAKDSTHEEYDAWRSSIDERQQYAGAGKDLDSFFSATMSTFLADEEQENRVYSPLNVYMALAMLAEVTEGESRAEILALLGSESIEALRTQANAIWNANYRNDGAVTSLLGSSVWLNKDLVYEADTLNRLADTYYASSFQGEMGSAGYNKALSAWLNEQTGGLLAEHANSVELSQETVMALATTVYYRAKWTAGFQNTRTAKRTFYTPDGELLCDFMNQTLHDSDYYWGEHFTATRKRLADGGYQGYMYLILPDEGVDPATLLTDSEALRFMTANGSWENHSGVKLNLSLPKFDVAANTDLLAGLRTLGVEACLDPATSDFSPLLADDSMPVWLDKAEHAARVIIDEDGIEAAAYTVMHEAGGAPPTPGEEIDFILDRPFIFVITGPDGLPLFVGTVYTP